MEVAVAGNEDFVLGYKLAGIRKAICASDDELERTVIELLNDKNVAILVLHESSMAKVSASSRKKLLESSRPVLITIGKGEEEDLRSKVRRAIGVDLYKKS